MSRDEGVTTAHGAFKSASMNIDPEMRNDLNASDKASTQCIPLGIRGGALGTEDKYLGFLD